MKNIFLITCMLQYAMTAAFIPHQAIKTITTKYVDRGTPALFDQIIETFDDVVGPHNINNIELGRANLAAKTFLANTNKNYHFAQSGVLQPYTKTLNLDIEKLQTTQYSVEAVRDIISVASEAIDIAEQSLTRKDLENEIAETSEKSNAASIPVESVETFPVNETIFVPSVEKILMFAIPAIGVWLCNPLLSFIDTTAVGVMSGVVNQAALNPATAVTDYAALLISFMYAGTTNLIAAAREQGDESTTKTLIGALQLSTYVGATIGIVLLVFSRTLLRTIIGNDGISPAVFDAAMKYVRIRALGMPAAAMIGTAQAACLGMRDIRSPLYILLSAAVVNLIGDMMFVGRAHTWLGGAAGAAWATVFSQYSAVVLFVHWFCNKPKLLNNQKYGGHTTKNRFDHRIGKDTVDGIIPRLHSANAGEDRIMRLRDTQPSTKKRTARKTSTSNFKKDRFSVRGFLQNKLSLKELVKIPPRSTLSEFSPYFTPVTTTNIGRVSGYVAMSHVVSSSFGTFNMAAQQVILSIFYCLCPIADSLSLTAQSFVPSIFEKKAGKKRTAALQQTGWNFLKAGGIFGALLAAVVSCVPLLSGYFTPDISVASLVNSVTPLLIGFFSIHGLLCASEGVLLGQKDLGFLGKMYAAFFFTVPYFMIKVKNAALSGIVPVSLKSVWSVMFYYQIIRVAAWTSRVVWLQRRTDKAERSFDV